MENYDKETTLFPQKQAFCIFYDLSCFWVHFNLSHPVIARVQLKNQTGVNDVIPSLVGVNDVIPSLVGTKQSILVVGRRK